MNIGAVIYVCVTDVVARMLVIYSCSTAHGACKSLELCVMYLLQLNRGLSQSYLLVSASWHFLSSDQEIFIRSCFSDCDSAFRESRLELHFLREWLKNSKELKEERETDNRLSSFFLCFLSPLSFRQKTREDDKDCFLMPSGHLTSK